MDVLSRTLQQLTDSAKVICQVWLHKISKDLLSLDSTNSARFAKKLLTISARICWAFTPQTQQGFAEPDSTTAMYTPQRLSIEGAESDSTMRYSMYKAQWLSIEDAESDSTAGRYRAQWLSVEDAELDSTAMYVYTEKGWAHLLSQMVSWCL